MAVSTVKYTFQGQTYDLTYNSSNGKYEATITAPQLSSFSQADHKYGGQVVATDDAGNTTTVNDADTALGESLKIRVTEKVAPVIVVSYPTESAFITNATPAITFKVTDNDSGVDINAIVISIDGKEISGDDIKKTETTGGYDCSYTPTTALSDGSHTIIVNASDNDGNVATAATVTFTIDTVPPTLSVTNPTEGMITNNPKLTVTGTTNDVTSKPVTVKVNGENATVNSDGTFSKELTLTDGDNTITIVATDKAGKESTITRHVKLDTGAPVIESITLTPNPVDCGKTFIISVTVTD